MTDSSSHNPLELLRDSLAEAQATVRAYDTKAQIVGIGYIFALNIISRLEALFPKETGVELERTLVAWIVVILPILLFGFVLYPTRKMAPKLADDSSDSLEQILYIDPARHGSVEELNNAANRADVIQENAFELLKVSHLRELKRKRFLRALFASGFCFVVLFLSQFLRSL